MPIFCFDVNVAFDGKRVPITRHNGASIGPEAEAIVLKRMQGSPENGPLWELHFRTLFDRH
jgi:hypothetical protein